MSYFKKKKQVVSFDLGTLGGADVGEDFVTSAFPARLELVRGDSSWTVLRLGFSLGLGFRFRF